MEAQLYLSEPGKESNYQFIFIMAGIEFVLMLIIFGIERHFKAKRSEFNEVPQN